MFCLNSTQAVVRPYTLIMWACKFQSFLSASRGTELQLCVQVRCFSDFIKLCRKFLLTQYITWCVKDLDWDLHQKEKKHDLEVCAGDTCCSLYDVLLKCHFTVMAQKEEIFFVCISLPGYSQLFSETCLTIQPQLFFPRNQPQTFKQFHFTHLIYPSASMNYIQWN